MREEKLAGYGSYFLCVKEKQCDEARALIISCVEGINITRRTIDNKNPHDKIWCSSELIRKVSK